MDIIATDWQPLPLIQRGNSKLAAAGMLMFNLPAIKEVCAMECAGCYAIKEQKVYPTALSSRMYRYEQSQKDDFVDKIQDELDRRRKRPKMFRVHASGEFYSQEYVDKWTEIAKANPDIVFYAYTKRKKYFNFEQLSGLDNFILINSLQYKRLNYGGLDAAPEGAFICPDQPGKGVQCGVTCTFCMTKEAQTRAPYFRKH